jgi:biotin transport system substrate-specific component
MLIDSYVMGSLADRKWTSKFMTTWLAIVIGSNVTFACGLLVLASYIPTSQLLQAGLWPFLPGDFVKTLVATGLIGLRSRSGNPT